MRFFLAILSGLLYPFTAHAAGYRLTQSGWDCTGFVGCGAGVDLATFLVARIVALVFPTGGGPGFIFYLTVVVFFYGSLRLVFSRGEEGKEAGKKAMQFAALGFALAMLIAGIMRFFCDYVYLLGAGGGTNICAIWWP
jgi:hypothetical protein